MDTRPAQLMLDYGSELWRFGINPELDESEADLPPHLCQIFTDLRDDNKICASEAVSHTETPPVVMHSATFMHIKWSDCWDSSTIPIQGWSLGCQFKRFFRPGLRLFDDWDPQGRRRCEMRRRMSTQRSNTRIVHYWKATLSKASHSFRTSSEREMPRVNQSILVGSMCCVFQVPSRSHYYIPRVASRASFS